jgi:hypothetical protein
MEVDTALPDWSRPHYQQPGGKPFLFFVVYGEFGELPALDPDKYRSTGVPPGLGLSRYDSHSQPDVLSRFQEGYLWNDLKAQNCVLAEKVNQSPECLILQGELDDEPTLNYLRDAVGLLTFLVDHGGIAVYDPWMFQWWLPAQWRHLIFDPASPVPTHHVVLLTSQEPEPSLTWFHTRGMRKFGRPELSVHNVPTRHGKAVIDLCNRFINFQAFGGVIEEGQKIKMRQLPSGMTCHHQGDLDDPDFNNVHVEITWDQERN